MTRFQLERIYRCCISDGVPRRSFLVALIVGTILNLINQGDALVGQGHLNLTKIILTYAVPYWRRNLRRSLLSTEDDANVRPQAQR